VSNNLTSATSKGQSRRTAAYRRGQASDDGRLRRDGPWMPSSRRTRGLERDQGQPSGTQGPADGLAAHTSLDSAADERVREPTINGRWERNARIRPLLLARSGSAPQKSAWARSEPTGWKASSVGSSFPTGRWRRVRLAAYELSTAQPDSRAAESLVSANPRREPEASLGGHRRTSSHRLPPRSA
jgi:hypothetical protein